MSSLGVITEQGDLGLGFDPITESDEETIKKNDEKKESSSSSN